MNNKLDFAFNTGVGYKLQKRARPCCKKGKGARLGQHSQLVMQKGVEIRIKDRSTNNWEAREERDEG